MWNTPPSRGPTALTSFKAGKMRATKITDNKFRVEADDRRGVLSLEKGNDGATHFTWKDRQTLQVIDDLLVFPGDQTLEKVDTGRPNDRVYLLTFRPSASRRFFFWMQEPDGSKDEERVREFNRMMNDPAAQAGPMRGILGTGGSNQLLTAAPPAVGLDELSDILSGLGYSGAGETQMSGTDQPSPTDSSSQAPSAPQGESGSGEGDATGTDPSSSSSTTREGGEPKPEDKQGE